MIHEFIHVKHIYLYIYIYDIQCSRYAIRECCGSIIGGRAVIQLLMIFQDIWSDAFLWQQVRRRYRESALYICYIHKSISMYCYQHHVYNENMIYAVTATSVVSLYMMLCRLCRVFRTDVNNSTKCLSTNVVVNALLLLCLSQRLFFSPAQQLQKHLL